MESDQMYRMVIGFGVTSIVLLVLLVISIMVGVYKYKNKKCPKCPPEGKEDDVPLITTEIQKGSNSPPRNECDSEHVTEATPMISGNEAEGAKSIQDGGKQPNTRKHSDVLLDVVRSSEKDLCRHDQRYADFEDKLMKTTDVLQVQLQMNNEFLGCLFSKGVLSLQAKDEIEDKTSNGDRVRCLLEKLCKKGPEAYKGFLQALNETEQHLVVTYVLNENLEDLYVDEIPSILPRADAEIEDKV